MREVCTRRIQVRSKVWDRLRAFAAEARRKFPAKQCAGLDRIGLGVYQDLKPAGYWCIPANSLMFATNGAEANFGFLVTDDRIDDQTPVVLTCVGSGDQKNFIVGESLHDFLCLGFHRGYFPLEQLSYNIDRTLEAIASGRWQPQNETDWWIGLGINEGQRPVLELLRQRLALKPWRNVPRKFARLQRDYLKSLELKTDYLTAGIEHGEVECWSKWFAGP
jgi:hypothetical protein